jgi:hypothetical protein
MVFQVVQVVAVLTQAQGERRRRLRFKVMRAEMGLSSATLPAAVAAEPVKSARTPAL